MLFMIFSIGMMFFFLNVYIYMLFIWFLAIIGMEVPKNAIFLL